MNAPTYLAARNDAGLLREYVVIRFGATLTHGGSGATYRRGTGLVRRLARMARLSFAETLEQVREDYEIAFA